jgi:hypothetical protein
MSPLVAKNQWLIRGCALLVVLHSLVTAFLWSSHIPFNAAPDEYEHIKTRIFVHLNGRLPHFNETPEFSIHLLCYPDRVPLYGNMGGLSGPQRLIRRLGRPEEGRFYELRQPYLFSPQLSHLLGGFLSRIGEVDNLDALRLFNHVMLALAALATFLAARLLWPRHLALASCAGLCVTLWPQMTYIGAYANDDILAVTAVTFLILGCVRIEKFGFTWPNTIFLGLATGIVLSAKYHAYPALFVLAYWGAGKLACQRNALGPLFFAAFLGLVMASPWFIRNWHDFDGDVFGMRTAREARMAVADALPRAWYLSSNAFKCQNPLYVLQQQGVFTWVRCFCESYYAAFGWPVAALGKFFYAVPLLVGLGILSVYLSAMRKHVARLSKSLPSAPVVTTLRMWTGNVRFLLNGMAGIDGRSAILFSLPLLLLCGLMAIINSALVDYQSQGRYALCSFPAIALLAIGSLRNVRHGHWLAIAIVVVQQILSLVILTRHL